MEQSFLGDKFFARNIRSFSYPRVTHNAETASSVVNSYWKSLTISALSSRVNRHSRKVVVHVSCFSLNICDKGYLMSTPKFILRLVTFSHYHVEVKQSSTDLFGRLIFTIALVNANCKTDAITKKNQLAFLSVGMQTNWHVRTSL